MFDAKTVLNQIGPLTLASVGARDFVADVEAAKVLFRFGSRRAYLDKIEVRLNEFDTYDVKVYAIDRKTFAVETVGAVEMVYCDQLAEIVTDLARNPRTIR